MLARRGSVQLVTGPMFSGKTTELMRRLRTGVVAGLAPLLVRPTVDTRWAPKEGVVLRTHSGSELRQTDGIVCEVLHGLSELAARAELPEIVGIDEGQFFEDLAPACQLLAGRGVTIVVAALNGTFDQTPFPSVSALIPLCDEICMLRAVCMLCRRRAAPFTALRRSSAGGEDSYTRVGGAETYRAACRGCLG